MLSLLYPLDQDLPGYSREQFHDDLVNECEKDIRKCFEAGAVRVSMDFTEGKLSHYLRNVRLLQLLKVDPPLKVVLR